MRRPLGYLEIIDDNIIYLAADGNILVIEDDFSKKEIKSNIKSFFNNEIDLKKTDILLKIQSGFALNPIRDLLYYEGFLYVVILHKELFDSDVRFSTAVLKGKFNYDYIDFEYFFKPDSYINGKIDTTHAGGRIVVNQKREFYLAVPEYYKVDKVNKLDNIFGKILKIKSITPVNRLGKIQELINAINFIINSSADLGYFPLLYKINTTSDKTEYCLFHFLVYNEIKFTEQDTSRNFRYLFSWDILERNDLVEAMADFIENRIYKFLAVNRGIVEVVNENELLFKFNKGLKNKLKSRMILDTKREYMYNSKTDQFDVFIKEVIADHLEYEKSVQKDTESVNYTNYHNVNMNNMLPYTKEELMRLQAKTHEFYGNENREGGFKFGKDFGIYIKIQIKEVYDSTASATVYESGDPNIKLKIGDIILF